MEKLDLKKVVDSIILEHKKIGDTTLGDIVESSIDEVMRKLQIGEFIIDNAEDDIFEEEPMIGIEIDMPYLSLVVITDIPPHIFVDKFKTELTIRLCELGFLNGESRDVGVVLDPNGKLRILFTTRVIEDIKEEEC